MTADLPSGDTALALERALRALRQLRAQLSEQQRRIDRYREALTEPIAIIGVGCRLPGGVRGADEFWDFIADGGDAISEIPGDRWDVDAFYDVRPQVPGKMNSRWGGFVHDIDAFDHEFFGISRTEANAMDPQHRIFLETAWEALEDAGQTVEHLAGSRTGIYLAIYGVDYATHAFSQIDRVNLYSTLGNLHSLAVGRLAYAFDLRGPAIIVDTACSSSLAAVHLACQGLRLGETDLAVCGGVNALLSPLSSVSLSQLHDSFVGDGRIKAFDASADGFVRGEGAGAVVLKRLSDAERDGDRIYAVVRGSAINQDGRGAGLIAPNGAAQRALLRAALASADVDPRDVAYIETHGTGTKLGDPIEADALADVYARDCGLPLYLGAVKTNVGHLEAAAGITALIKAALCVERATILPNLHFRELNPHIDLGGTTIQVPVVTVPWPAEARERVAGVSGFGLNGSNAHVLLAEAPPQPILEPEQSSRGVFPLVLSAKSPQALLKLARRYGDLLRVSGASLSDISYSAASRRSAFPLRAGLVARTPDEAATILDSYVRGDVDRRLEVGLDTTSAPNVVLLFSGADSFDLAGVSELYATEPAFAAELDQCDASMRAEFGESFLGGLLGGDAHELAEDVKQAALVSVEYSLAMMWRRWGVTPAAVIGHSVGEYVAAAVAEAMTPAELVRVVTVRARLLRECEPGAMVAIGAAVETVDALRADCGATGVSVAAVNSPHHVTVSGTAEAVGSFAEHVGRSGYAVEWIDVPVAGHSRLAEPALARLRECLVDVHFRPATIPVISTVTGELWRWDEPPSVEYWLRHTGEAVRFADAIDTAISLGYRTFVSAASGADLLGAVRSTVPASTELLLLPTLRTSRDVWFVLYRTLVKLHVHGIPLDWDAILGNGHRLIRLPSYPFTRTRCWHDLHGAVPTAGAPTGPGNGPRGEDSPVEPPTQTPPRVARSLIPVETLRAAGADQRRSMLEEQLLDLVQFSLGYGSMPVTAQHQLAALGLDSLMAVELSNDLHLAYGVTLPATSFLRDATVATVAETVARHIELSGSPGESEDLTAAATGIVARRRAGELEIAGLLTDLESFDEPTNAFEGEECRD